MATTSGKAGLFAFDPARCDAMSEVLAQRWWAVGLRGILAIIFGLICLLTPGIALGAFVIVFAAYMFVDGVFAIISGIRAARSGENWGLLILEGVVDLADECNTAPPLPSVPPGTQPTSKAANHPSGSVRARRRAAPCMSPSWLQAVPPSMFSIMPRSRQGALTTGRQGSGPNTTPPITPPSCSILTATISKPYATALNESRRARPPSSVS